MQSDSTYTAVVWAAEEGGYWAEVAELPGCFSQGESKGELLDNIQDAIETYLDDDAETAAGPLRERPEFIKIPMPARRPAGAAD